MNNLQKSLNTPIIFYDLCTNVEKVTEVLAMTLNKQPNNFCMLCYNSIRLWHTGLDLIFLKIFAIFDFEVFLTGSCYLSFSIV